LEIGEVLLTAGILEIFGQFLFTIVASDIPLRQDVCKLKTRESGELGGFAQGQKAPRIERYRQLLLKTFFGFAFGDTKAAGDGIRNV
jgi:hypothetical protein